jgi:hypothetical protein
MYIVHNLRIMSAKQQPMTAKQCSLIHVACNVVKKKKNDIRINSGYVVKTTHTSTRSTRNLGSVCQHQDSTAPLTLPLELKFLA